MFTPLLFTATFPASKRCTEGRSGKITSMFKTARAGEMPRARAGLRKDVYFVIDDSASMGSYSRRVREAIASLTAVDRNSNDTEYAYNYISFSSRARFAKDLKQLPIDASGTNIELAFKLLNEKVALSSFPDELIVIFISDGCDHDRLTINSRLKALGGTQRFVKSTLFTVAVGSGFPTSMVVSALRPNYHNASDCLPLVFPVTSPEQVMSVFEQMSEYVFSKEHFNLTMEFDESATLDELEEGVDRIYNFFTVKCANEGNKDACTAMIQQANGLLGQMLKQAKAKESEKQDALSEAMQDEARKPLASRILNVARSQRKRVQTAIISCMTRFNSYLDETVKGNLMSKLSDVEQQKVLAYGSVVGKHLVKSLKYHSADFATTKAHLAKVLAEYDEEQAAADAEVSDYIITQAEAMMDARECAKEMLNNAESLVSVIDTLAVVGRLINIRTCSGTQINPYLIQVVSVPPILQHMNTIDFFRLHSGNYNDVNRPGEVANCLLPVTRNVSPKNFLRGPLGAHICTYLLCKNQELYFPNAMVAMQAALVTYCLEQSTDFYNEVLEETYNSFACLKASGAKASTSAFFQYVRHVGTEGFKEALVTESDNLANHLKCEHLTKFIFALYLLIRDGTKFSSSQLLDRMRACMVEMVGRGGEGGGGAIYQYIDRAPQHSSVEILNMVPQEAALNAFTSHEGNQVFTACAREVCQTADACKVTNVKGPTDIPVSHMGFTRAKLSAIFARLNAMCGNAASSDFELPDVGERLAITYHGLSHSSYDRQVMLPVAPVSLESLQEELERAYRTSVCKQADNFFAPIFRKRFEATHTTVTPLPPDYRSRYKAETGRDVTDDFGVSEETWLPTVACAAPQCANFLRRLGKAAFTVEGKPRIADGVLRHLQTEPRWMVHCGSRCAKELADAGPQSEEEVRWQVARLREGGLLREGGQDLGKRKASQVESVEHMGGSGELLRVVKQKIQNYKSYEANFAYEEFKTMMDAAYELPEMVSAAQESRTGKDKGCGLGEDFEMVDVPSVGTFGVKSAGS